MHSALTPPLRRFPALGPAVATGDKCYPSFNPNGQLCSEDADCDEGTCDPLFFQCRTNEPQFAGYGICACPGTDSMEIVPGEACFQ